MATDLLAHVITFVPMEGDGLLDFAGDKVNALKSLLRSFAVVAGIGFVIMQAIQSRGALARIVISGFAAAVFIWIVFNVTSLKDRVDNEMTGAPHLPVQVHQG